MRIVVTGPESSGKSRLTRWLGRRLDVPTAPEYARTYLETHGPGYTYDLLLDMSRRHQAFQQQRVPPEAPLGIFDTDLVNYRIWCDEVYGRCHPELLAALEAETDHAYLVCAPDLPWTFDPLRENPDDRDRLFELHLNEITRLERTYRIVRGNGRARYVRGLTAARELIASARGSAEGNDPESR